LPLAPGATVQRSEKETIVTNEVENLRAQLGDRAIAALGGRSTVGDIAQRAADNRKHATEVGKLGPGLERPFMALLADVEDQRKFLASRSGATP
jgi:hypothetical protein